MSSTIFGDLFLVVVKWINQCKVMFNPIISGVSESQLIVGGGALSAQPPEIDEKASWDPILLKVILKSIKVRFTCKKLGPYLKYLLRFWDWKISSLWDFDSTWPIKMLVTRSILEIKISNFGIKLVFMKRKICVLKSKLKNHFFNTPLF